MSGSVNRVIVVGNLGHDPRAGTMPTGERAVLLQVATNRRYTAQDGAIVDETEWHRVVAFGRTAENIEKYVRKGNEIAVEGRLRTKKYTGKDGVERNRTEIVAERVSFGKREDEQTSGQR